MPETTEFGEAIKAVLSKKSTSLKSVSKESVSPHIEYEVDPTHPLDVILRRVTGTGKVSMEIYVMFSTGKTLITKNGEVIDKSDITHEFIKKFFSGALPADGQITIGSIGMPKVINDHRFIEILYALVHSEKVGLAIKNGDTNTDHIYKTCWSGWNHKELYNNNFKEQFPWYASDNSYPSSLMEIFENYTSDGSRNRIRKEVTRQGGDYAQLTANEKRIIATMADYFDVPFAVKMVMEYRSSDLEKLTSNSIEEILSLKDGQSNYRASPYANSEGAIPRYNLMYIPKYIRERDEIAQDFFEFKDKNAFWNYIKRASEEGFEHDLDTWIHKWRQCLMNQIYIYGHIIEMYPSRYTYAEYEGEIIKIPTKNPSLSFMLTTTNNKCKDVENARTSGELARLMGNLPDLLDCEKKIKGTTYKFRCLRTKEDFQREASNQNNCVESVCLKNILEGKNMLIFSLTRDTDDEGDSWITVEIDPLTGQVPFKYGGTRQALKKSNHQISAEEEKIVNIFEKECIKKIKKYRSKKDHAEINTNSNVDDDDEDEDEDE